MYKCCIHYLHLCLVREAAKKVLLLMAGPFRGGGIKGQAIKEKKLFLEPFSNVPTFQRQLSSRGEGGLGLNGRPIKRRTFFCGFP